VYVLLVLLQLLVRTSSPPMMWSMMPYSRASMGDMYLHATGSSSSSSSSAKCQHHCALR
jgi:hypothetical protein